MSDRVFAIALTIASFFLLIVYVASQFKVSTDITDFFPPAEEQEVATVVKDIALSPISRSMTICLSGGDVGELLEMSTSLTQALEKFDGIERVSFGPSPELPKFFHEVLFPYRYGFLSDGTESNVSAQLSDESLSAASQRLRHELASVGGPVVRTLAASDPLLVFYDRMTSMENETPKALKVLDNHYFGADESYTIIFLKTRAPSLEVSSQIAVLAEIKRAFEEVRSSLELDVKMEMSGLNRFAVRVQQTTKADIARISSISALSILLVFFVLYRDFSLLGLLFLPLAFGLVSGTAFCLCVYGRIHGLTLAFGATLLGVCVDYPIHFLNHFLLVGKASPHQSAQVVWPGIRLGGLTTVAGFSCLAMSAYPGIREVSLFAIVGVVAAIICSRCSLPYFIGKRRDANKDILGNKASYLQKMEMKPMPHLWRRCLLVLIIGTIVFGLPRLTWSNSLSALSAVDAELTNEDNLVRERASDFEMGRFVVVSADSAEQALQVNDSLFPLLKAAKRDNILSQFSSFHTLLWSEKLQERNLRIIQEQNLAPRLLAALGDEGFRKSSFENASKELEELPPPLSFESFLDSPLGVLAEPFFFRANGKFYLLNFLSSVDSPVLLAEIVDDLPGVLYLDQKNFLDTSYTNYKKNAFRMILFGMAIVFFLTWLRFRSVKLSLRVCLPASLACTGSFAVIGAVGVPITLMHVFGVLLVFSMGMDYGIFLAEAKSSGSEHNAALFSILLSAIFTVLGFGLLAISSSPALSALGFVTAIGVSLSFLCAVAYPPKKPSPVELK